MFQVHGLVLHGDGFFHGDDMHTDACAAGRHHLGDAGQGDVGHAFEEGGHVGVVPESGVAAVGEFFHVEEFGGAGHEHGQDVAALGLGRGAAVVVVVVAVVVFQQADIAHLVQKFLEFLFAVFVDFA